MDTFVVSGLRSGRLPILLPGVEEKITWRLIPMECGYVRLPEIRVFNRRKVVAPQAQNSTDSEVSGDEREVVEVVDVRRDRRVARGTWEPEKEENQGQMTILVHS